MVLASPHTEEELMTQRRAWGDIVDKVIQWIRRAVDAMNQSTCGDAIDKSVCEVLQADGTVDKAMQQIRQCNG